MSDVTEIYICKAGQSLKQGRIEYSDYITDKSQAESDARRRCGSDRAIAKIAYYKVSENGDFRVFFSYNNPQAATGAVAQENDATDADGTPANKTKKKRKKVKTSWLSRLLSPFSGRGKKEKKKKKKKKGP